MFDNSSDEMSFEKNYRRIYPDFYKPNSSEQDGCILDAKYKRLQNGVGREDLYQVISYMHTMTIKQGGFIYPLAQTEQDSEGVRILIQRYKLANQSGTLQVLGVKIPLIDGGSDSRTCYGNFRTRMQKLEKELKKYNWIGK